MENTLLPETPLPEKGWTVTEIIEQQHEKRNLFFEWWYRLTAIPEAPAHASFFKREVARKSRLTSTVLFFYTCIVTAYLPVGLFTPKHLVFWIDGMLVIGALCALVLNRMGNIIGAGILIIATFEIAVSTVLFTTIPLDEASIQFYDLYIVAELLAVSLLPMRAIFIVACIDSIFISASLLFQPHTLILAEDLHVQLFAILLRPLALQLIVAGVASVWVYTTSKAIVRADRAEMIATLEHALVEQKQDLESGIEHILQTHIAVANGNLNARAPLTQENALWLIAQALNTLLVRLQRASIAEKELQRVEQAVATAVEIIQLADQQQPLPPLDGTQTAIGPLLAALQGKTVTYTPSSIHSSTSNSGYSGHHPTPSAQFPKSP